MNDYVIVDIDYIDYEAFIKLDLNLRDARIMDDFSKMAMVVSYNLLDKVRAHELDDERKCVVLTSGTGPLETLLETCNTINHKGSRGINPSKFPNTMLSTSMSRIAIEHKIKGPSTVIYEQRGYRTAFHYAKTQIANGSVLAALILFVQDSNSCFGLFMENVKSAIKRNIRSRFDSK